MKHLKTYGKFTDVHYKVFESKDSSDDVLQDLNDICLDLEYSDLDASIKHSKHQSKSYFSIKIESLRGHLITQIGNMQRFTPEKYFEFNDDVQTTILRINQYMKELGFKAYYMTKGYSHATNDFVVTTDEKLRYVKGTWISNTDKVLLIELIFYK